VFLYPSDWSQPRLLRKLASIRIETERVIKIYAAHDQNIGRITGRPIQLIPIDYKGLTHEDIFDYGERGSYNGRDLEMYLQKYSGLDQSGIAIARAMLRFGYQEALGTNRLAMAVKNGDEPVFDNPFSFIHHFKSPKPDVNTKMHLDIYMPQSIERLSKIIDLDNLARLATPEEVGRIRALELENEHGKERLLR